VSATTTRTINATFALLPPTTLEKASADSVTFKQSGGTFICCSAVRVRNARGAVVPNVTVNWTTASSAPLSLTTDANGVSGGVGITFNGATPPIGSHPLTAAITIGTGETRSITFTYFVVAGAIVGTNAPPPVGPTSTQASGMPAVMKRP
jgi:hypothetical protein